MFVPFLEIYLMPQQVILRRSHRGLRGSVEAPLETKTELVHEDQIAWLTEACSGLLAQNRHAGNLHVIFSDLWARYNLITLGEAELSDEDAMSLARAQFSRHYPGADSALWPLRLARQDKRMLAVAINPALLAAIKQIASASGRRLVQVEPLFARVFDQYEKELAGSDGWVLLDEPGMLIAAFIERGQLLSLHCQRCDDGREEAAHLLLERQAALLSRPSGEVHVFSFSGSPLALREPWRTKYENSPQFPFVKGGGNPVAHHPVNCAEA